MKPVTRLTNFALLGLASGGVYRAGPVTRSAGALLPHRFTLTTPPPSCEERRLLAVYFLWHCPGSCERWALPTTVSCEARTFLCRPELIHSRSATFDYQRVRACRDRPAHSALKLYGAARTLESHFSEEFASVSGDFKARRAIRLRLLSPRCEQS
ncbi:MAG: hypothetical protein JWP89_5748 [Schlesneria sp.]|nr:hypothetical protein [Schlesneria sp.]